MNLSHDPTMIDASRASGGRQRAGLRIASPSQQPNGAFVVVEMFVLVLVATLAMVSIIVSTVERADGAETHATVRSETRLDRDRTAAPAVQAAGARHAAPGVETR